jgi:hypothetical protein
VSKHLSDEELSSLADTPSAGSGESIRHMHECRACRDRHADLRAVRRVLGALPPPAVPPDVFAGISARVKDAPAPVSAAGTPLDGPGQRRGTLGSRARRLGPRHLGIAAAIALVGGVASVALHGNQGASTAPTNTALAASGVASPSDNASRAATPARTPVTVLASVTGPLVVALGRNYHHATLSVGAYDLMADVAHPSGAGSPAASNGTKGVLPTANCLQALGAHLGSFSTGYLTLIAVEAARYDTRPATVLVLVNPAEPERGVALALADRCTTDQPQILDQVALTP